MNSQMVTLLILKDLFLSRRLLFAYFLAGLASVVIGCLPNDTIAFVGFILIVTTSIGMGMHLIGELILEERKRNTLAFVMSLPVNVTEYSTAKILVVLMTFLIPWSSMLMGSVFLIAVLPWSKDGILGPTLLIFFELFASFALQLITAIVSESVGWTIAVMIAGNVFLNLFLVKLFSIPEISEVIKTDVFRWTPLMSQVLSVEIAVIVLSVVIALTVQSRKRCFI
jgi:hypothetical protein